MPAVSAEHRKSDRYGERETQNCDGDRRCWSSTYPEAGLILNAGRRQARSETWRITSHTSCTRSILDEQLNRDAGAVDFQEGDAQLLMRDPLPALRTIRWHLAAIRESATVGSLNPRFNARGLKKYSS